MKFEDLENEISEFFNENYEGRYRASIDINEPRNETYLHVAFEQGSEKPGVGSFVDEIFDILEIEDPRIEADWYPEENRYDIMFREAGYRPLPEKTP